jgi:hypothetical protein
LPVIMSAWVFLGVMVLVALVVIVCVVAVSSATRPAAPPPDAPPRPNPGGPYPLSPTPLPPKPDPTYVAPAAEKAAATTTDEAPERSPSRPPKRIVHCPRCRQAIINDEKLAQQRVACPVCHCKFFLPREA